MKKSALICLAGMGLALAACGKGGDDGSSTLGISSSVSETGNMSADTLEGVDSNNDNETGPGDGDGDTDADAGDGDGTPGDGDGDDGDDGNTTSNQKWDVLGVPDAAFNCGFGGDDEPEYSYLWAANSTQGTISKLDTKTVTELGRYIVRPDSQGSPSRTSVSLSGHVAVANRNGGVTKVYATEEFCDESNGMPGIQTSNNNQALPWGTEECIAWHKPMQYASQRPVAWGAGEFNEGTCQWEDEVVWTAATQGQTPIDVYLLDGDDGSTIDMVTLQGVQANFYGIYGGAVDANGDFWGSQLGIGHLVKVNREDMTYQIWPMAGSGYGMTVDAEGYVWTCSSTVSRFDPNTEQWQTANVGGQAGCMAEATEDGLLWMSAGNNIIGVNRDTLQVEKTWNTGGSYGISIDFEGYVWAVAFGSNAHKVDPETGQVWTYNGLVGAYTYSDMTGYALSNVGSPSG
jgi:hypothetical protein